MPSEKFAQYIGYTKHLYGQVKRISEFEPSQDNVFIDELSIVYYY